MRKQEPRASLESAKRAVDLYRDAFDAVSMVTMQFNTGATYRSLGDDRAAVAALQAAVDLDREYDFRKDAEDNYQLLLQWNNEKAGPDKVAALMTGFPQRSAALKFAWFGSDADVSPRSRKSIGRRSKRSGLSAVSCERPLMGGLSSPLIERSWPHEPFARVPRKMLLPDLCSRRGVSPIGPPNSERSF